MKLKNLAAALWLGAAALLACSPAFAQSAALVETPVVSGNCVMWSPTSTNMIKDTGIKCSGGNVRVDDTTISTSALMTPNVFGLNAPGILNNTSKKSFYFTKSVPTTGQDGGDFQCYRNANYTGVSTQPHGFVNPCLYSYTVAQPGSGAGTPSGGGFEWSGLFRLDNYSNIADGTENVAAYIQGRKYGTAPTWGGVTEVIDFAANPVAGTVTDEHDLSVSGTDNNNARVGLDLWVRNIDALWGPGPVTSEAAYGIRLNTDAYTTVKNGIRYEGKYIWGINMSAATFNSAAINLGDQHPICWDTACTRKMFAQAGVVYLTTTAGNTFSWSDSTGQFTANAVNSGGAFYLNAGAKACFDSATCGTYLKQDLTGTLSTYAGSASPSLTVNNAGIQTAGIAAVAVDASTRVSVATGQKLSLDGATGGSYFSQTSGVIGTFVGGSGSSSLNINSLGIQTAGVSAVSGSFSSTVTAAGLISTAGVVLNTNQKYCGDGSGCANYMLYDGTTMTFYRSGSAKFSVNMSTGTTISWGGFQNGFTAGVTCTGINAATFTSSGGIVTHC